MTQALMQQIFQIFYKLFFYKTFFTNSVLSFIHKKKKIHEKL